MHWLPTYRNPAFAMLSNSDANSCDKLGLRWLCIIVGTHCTVRIAGIVCSKLCIICEVYIYIYIYIFNSGFKYNYSTLFKNRYFYTNIFTTPGPTFPGVGTETYIIMYLVGLFHSGDWEKQNVELRGCVYHCSKWKIHALNLMGRN